MTLIETLDALAQACERHAAHHFAAALDETNDHAVGLRDIDRGLECLSRAANLRAALNKQESGNV